MLNIWHTFKRVRWFSWLGIALVAVLLQACGGGESDAVSVGEPAPAFTLPDVTGERVSLADYEAQPVLLYFHMAMG